ncbi:hypothetical protein FGB62_57g02 [Gracilaria domingensis]|nr:hypothetical protein FGB62_57g02 [Gracilaria domingensis]
MAAVTEKKGEDMSFFFRDILDTCREALVFHQNGKAGKRLPEETVLKALAYVAKGSNGNPVFAQCMQNCMVSLIVNTDTTECLAEAMDEIGKAVPSMTHAVRENLVRIIAVTLRQKIPVLLEGASFVVIDGLSENPPVSQASFLSPDLSVQSLPEHSGNAVSYREISQCAALRGIAMYSFSYMSVSDLTAFMKEFVVWFLRSNSVKGRALAVTAIEKVFEAAVSAGVLSERRTGMTVRLAPELHAIRLPDPFARSFRPIEGCAVLRALFLSKRRVYKLPSAVRDARCLVHHFRR